MTENWQVYKATLERTEPKSGWEWNKKPAAKLSEPKKHNYIFFYSVCAYVAPI